MMSGGERVEGSKNTLIKKVEDFIGPQNYLFFGGEANFWTKTISIRPSSQKFNGVDANYLQE